MALDVRKVTDLDIAIGKPRNDLEITAHCLDVAAQGGV
jgi:hypothetical protein